MSGGYLRLRATPRKKATNPTEARHPNGSVCHPWNSWTVFLMHCDIAAGPDEQNQQSNAA